MATDLTSIYTTTVNEGGISPYEKWSGKALTTDKIHPFVTVGCMSTTTRKHELE